MLMDTNQDNLAIGKPLNRVDGVAKVTGRAMYAADAPIANCAHALLVDSTIANGRITSIDTASAEKAPGVIAVITPAYLDKHVPLKLPGRGEGGGGMMTEHRLPLSDFLVHYGGQHIAVVVAETIEQARSAATLLKMNYDAQPPVIALNDPKAKSEKPGDVFGESAQPKWGQPVEDVVAQGKDSLTVVKQTYLTPVETHNPMEMSATTALWDNDNLTVYDSTQHVFGVRGTLAAVFGIPPQQVRVLCPFTGGGFGCKGAQWPHTILAAAAAKAVNRPVKLMVTRQQMFSACGHRPPTEQTLTIAATKDGKLSAIRHDTVMHGSLVGEHLEPCGNASSRILYACPNVEISHTVNRMNVQTPTFMRAPGECPGTYALESAMDELAYALNIDPIQLRLINHADNHPQTQKPWSSKHLKECYQWAADKFGWSKRNPQPGSMKTPDGKLLGFGMATATYPGYRFGGKARIKLMVDNGKLRAVGASAVHDLGTGAYTVFTQLTADLVGLPIEQVKF